MPGNDKAHGSGSEDDFLPLILICLTARLKGLCGAATSGSGLARLLAEQACTCLVGLFEDLGPFRIWQST